MPLASAPAPRRRSRRCCWRSRPAPSSAAVQETIQLYAMATGQTVKGMPEVTPVTLGQTGGALYQIPGYSNGSPSSFPGGLLPSMGLDRIAAGLASNAGTMVIHLDGPATTALLNGVAVKAVASNPRTVQAASLPQL